VFEPALLGKCILLETGQVLVALLLLQPPNCEEGNSEGKSLWGTQDDVFVLPRLDYRTFCVEESNRKPGSKSCTLGFEDLPEPSTQTETLMDA
jgi:hypothetical protein